MISDQFNDISRNKSSSVSAIITCYFPKKEELSRLINSIAKQVQHILLIDNGGFKFELIDLCFENETLLKQKLVLIKANSNLGTAGGYNLGAKKAWEIGSSHILLLDQDSECHQNMVEELLSLESFLIQQNKKVAVVGPYYICKSNNQPAPFIQHKGLSIRRIFLPITNQPLPVNYSKTNGNVTPKANTDINSTPHGKKFVSCSYLISSGSLISKNSWHAIGETNEDLFLDFTDIEWGLRATNLNYECFGSFDAQMYHLIGDEQLSILGRKISLHSPLRHYYAFRNCVWLFRQPYVALKTRLNYLIKLIPKFIIYSFFSHEFKKQSKFMILGIYHGFSNKMGRYEN